MKIPRNSLDRTTRSRDEGLHCSRHEFRDRMGLEFLGCFPMKSWFFRYVSSNLNWEFFWKQPWDGTNCLKKEIFGMAHFAIKESLIIFGLNWWMVLCFFWGGYLPHHRFLEKKRPPLAWSFLQNLQNQTHGSVANGCQKQGPLLVSLSRRTIK